MAAEQSETGAAAWVDPELNIDPLAPLTKGEIIACRDAIQSIHGPHTGLLFKQITLREPVKEELAPRLDAEFEGRPIQKIDRRAFINYYLRKTVSKSI